MGEPLRKYLQTLLEIASGSADDLYLVGGTIRDHLLGKECSDFDFTAKNVRKLANRFASGTQSPCISLDATPGRETLRVIVQKKFHFDFTDMQGNCIEEDLAQRDFTINAMALRLVDFLDGKDTLMDPNRGREDLKNKIIRVLPGPIFSADPLRMLRAFRFASALEFIIDADTIRQIEIEKSNLEKTALERIYYEWILFLSGERVHELLKLMGRTGLLQCAIPETAELRQSSETQASAWEISMQTFNRLEDLLSIPQTIIPSANHAGFLTGRKKALLKFSALLHSLHPSHSEEPLQNIKENLDPSSPQSSPPMEERRKPLLPSGEHPQGDRLGGMRGYNTYPSDCNSDEVPNTLIKINEQAKIVPLLKRLKASNADIRFIYRTILFQQTARESRLEFAGEQVDESALYLFTKKYAQELMPGIFLACAVQSASEKNRETESFLQAAHRVVDFYFQRYLPAMNHKTLISGDDLIQHFQLTPSPLFQLVLDKVEEGRILGTITSKNQATAIARQIIATHKTENKT